MPYPFPGMDPFLEMPPYWSDFAPKLLTQMSNELLRQLLPRYDVRLEEYLILSDDDRSLHRVRSDITIGTSSAWTPPGNATALLEPITAEIEYPSYDPLTQRHLRIMADDRVVTVVELLSPANKTLGEGGLDAYQEKRAECNRVELDLLRGGQRLPMASPLPPGDYYALIGRTHRKPRCEAIGWHLRAPLPTIRIPLLPEDPEVSLDLAAVFRSTYEPAFYDRRLPYDRPLVPPLRPEDDSWARELLAARAP